MPLSRGRKGGLLALAILLLAGCSKPPVGTDLLAGCGTGSSKGSPVDPECGRALSADSQVAGRDRGWVLSQAGKHVRVNDEVRRTLPASPPSRLAFQLDLAKGMHLAFAYGMPGDRHDKPGVEFVVKVKKDGREDTVWSTLVDPISRPAHRRWQQADVDLSEHAGEGVELVLETRSFEQGEDARRAFWANPALVPGASMPLPPPAANAPGAALPADPPRGQAPNDAPLAIVYLVDTLRADHTSPYGYARDTTPELARFAKDAVVFEQGIAHASWTKPSVASLMTSQLPGRHRAVQLRDSLDDEHLTLAELMSRKGFSTGAAIANSVIYSQGVNFEQGFDFFVGLHGAENRPSKIVDAAGVVDAALSWLDARRGLPGFLYVHTMDPHVPYTPPPPFDQMYEPHPTPEHPAVDPRFDFKEPLDRERLMAQYDAEVAYGDREFGRFVRALKERGLYDRALIVFMADHGEEFEDHGQWLHGRSVFDELVHIPLIVKFPKQRDGGRRVAQQVREVDVLPTVLSEMGLPVLGPPLVNGHPLQAVVKGGAPEELAISEISHRGFVAQGARGGRDKYIRRFSPSEDELYFDLVADPKEKVNRIEGARERAKALRAQVEAATVPNPFRYTLRFTGSGRYEVRLRTGGWLEGIQAAGLGLDERYDMDGNGRKVLINVKPQPGQPREVSFGVRPRSAPVWVEGTRDGKPLTPADVALGLQAMTPAAVPFELPDLEPRNEEHDRMQGVDVTRPPPEDKAGLQVWLVMNTGVNPLDIPADQRDQLCALGYLTCK